MANNHDFKRLQKVKYLGNKGVITQVSPNTVVVSLVGPFLFGEQTFVVKTSEFKQLKKG
jgi:hypothetical protein